MRPLEHLQAMRDGRVPVPPVYETLGLSIAGAEEGQVDLDFVSNPSLAGPYGTLAGGIITTALDTVAAWACDTQLPEGQHVVTVDIKVNFIAPILTDGKTCRAQGKILSAGRRIMVAQSDCWAADGTHCAVAIGSFYVVRS